MAVIQGDATNDLIFGDQSDQFTPTGENFIASENSADVLFGGEGNDTVYGLGNGDVINGNQGDDVVSGDAGNDTVFGGKDNDTVIGGAGEDFLRGDLGDDLLFGLDDNDSIRGGKQDDTLFGGLGDDTLLGDKNSDRLVGGDGDDRFDGGTLSDIVGEANNDILVGGAGADIFGLRPHANNGGLNTVIIEDYEVGVDRLTLILDANDPQQVAATLTPAGIASVQNGGDTLLQFTDINGATQTLATLEGITATTIIPANEFVALDF